MILTVSNLKGGSGKTTSTMFLAHAFTSLGRNVTVIDACPSGAAALWSRDAKESDNPLPFEALSLPNKDLDQRLPGLIQDSHDAIIDTPPAESAITASAIKAADFVLIPSNARPEDVRQAEIIAKQALELGKPSAVAFVRVRPQETSMVVCEELLGNAGVAVFESRVNELMAVAWSAGQRLNDTKPYDELAKEILEIFQ